MLGLVKEWTKAKRCLINKKKMDVPVRTSLLDVVQNNLKTANRNAFIHRYIYIGEYSYNDKNILDLMISIIDTVNNEYCEEPLTGLMLVLPRYFVHFLDGSDDSIVKHFMLLKEKNSEYLVRGKLLVAFHHVNRRMFDNWSFKKEQPPAMLEKIKPTWDYQKTKPYVEQCVKKVYSFMVTLRRIDLNKGRMFKGEQKHLKEDLPSVTLLEFLLNSEYLYDFDQMMNIFHTNPVTRSYSECVWPIRSDNVYYEILSKDDEPFKDDIKFNQLVRANWLSDYSKK